VLAPEDRNAILSAAADATPFASEYSMTPSNAHDPTEAESTELAGLDILLVEDSWHIGSAMKNLLRLMGATVAGPAATAAEAGRLMSEHTPDVAIVDVSLRGGERADSLIDRLHDQGVPIIVISGYAEVPEVIGKAMAVLQKPVSEAQLLASLRPLIAQKA
jgi:DNA-binding NtrC family response regulator